MSPFDITSGSDKAVTVVISVYSLIIYKRYVTRSNQPLSHPFEQGGLVDVLLALCRIDA